MQNHQRIYHEPTANFANGIRLFVALFVDGLHATPPRCVSQRELGLRGRRPEV